MACRNWSPRNSTPTGRSSTYACRMPTTPSSTRSPSGTAPPTANRRSSTTTCCARPAPPHARCWWAPQPSPGAFPWPSAAPRGSRVTHAASGRAATYGELAAAAATQPVPAAPRLKDPSQFRLIGKSTLRKDTPAKVDGSAIYGIDVRQPGMLYAALRRAPTLDAKLVGFDREAALKLPGVVDAFAIPDGIAVVANSTWQARKAAETLEATFDDSAVRALNSAGDPQADAGGARRRAPPSRVGRPSAARLTTRPRRSRRSPPPRCARTGPTKCRSWRTPRSSRCARPRSSPTAAARSGRRPSSRTAVATRWGRSPACRASSAG